MGTATIIELIIGIVGAFLASSGIWGFILYKQQRKDAKQDDFGTIKDALKGILYSDILDTGEKYLAQEYITVKQMNNFKKYLYDPYKALGGDGMADEIWDQLSDLPHHEI